MDFSPFLSPSDVIDWREPAVLAQALTLARDSTDRIEIARRCFHFVRDEIEHSSDFKRNPVTCRASDVLKHGTGFCYAKSHLLAALLRASGIPAGLGYQRLRLDGEGSPMTLHGFNAVHLSGLGWYRIDARGNRADVHAEFDPPNERLAFATVHAGEWTSPEVYADPLPEVVRCLTTCCTYDEVLQNLPDAQSIPSPSGRGSG